MTHGGASMVTTLRRALVAAPGAAGWDDAGRIAVSGSRTSPAGPTSWFWHCLAEVFQSPMRWRER